MSRALIQSALQDSNFGTEKLTPQTASQIQLLTAITLQDSNFGTKKLTPQTASQIQLLTDITLQDSNVGTEKLTPQTTSQIQLLTDITKPKSLMRLASTFCSRKKGDVSRKSRNLRNFSSGVSSSRSSSSSRVAAPCSSSN